MKVSEIKKLNEYNRAFYSKYGASFARRREYFWPSWSKFVQASELLKGQDTFQVADVGCGSGRFALFWEEHIGLPVSYVGIDIAEEMLGVAREQLQNVSFSWTLQQSDIVEDLLNGDFSLPNQPDLITLFGVLHHIPDQDVRRQLLQALLDSLPVSGELWLTIWNPQRTGTRSPKELEKLSDSGDSLIGWQHKQEAQRYVHWISEEEEKELFDSLSQSVVLKRWEEDSPGERGNICILLQKT